jgi:hypothetical protein
MLKQDYMSMVDVFGMEKLCSKAGPWVLNAILKLLFRNILKAMEILKIHLNKRKFFY